MMTRIEPFVERDMLQKFVKHKPQYLELKIRELIKEKVINLEDINPFDINFDIINESQLEVFSILLLSRLRYALHKHH